ncbi:MAG: hypothetical protein KIT17_20565 [Rubrivivax sp.]|nr:hypothetical protein [Rubrivivax sp.]
MQRLALAAALLMFVVVSASAWLRLAAPRPPCTDWPPCRAAAQASLPAWPVLAAPASVGTVRAVHRVAASAVLLVLLVMLALIVHALRRDGASAGVSVPVVAMLLLALALSALGIAAPGSRASAVLLGNLLGGATLLALAWLSWRRLGHAPRLPRGLRRAAGTGVLLWLAQFALGAWSGSPPREGTMAPMLHLALAFVAAPWAFALGAALHSTARRAEGRALMSLAAAQVLLGGFAAALAAPAPLVWLHNALAAAGVALQAGLATGSAEPS